MQLVRQEPLGRKARLARQALPAHRGRKVPQVHKDRRVLKVLQDLLGLLALPGPQVLQVPLARRGHPVHKEPLASCLPRRRSRTRPRPLASPLDLGLPPRAARSCWDLTRQLTAPEDLTL